MEEANQRASNAGVNFMDSSKEPLPDWIEREFEFDKDDLLANRQGVMSKKQKDNAIRQGTRLLSTTLAAAVIVLGLLVYETPHKESFWRMLSNTITIIFILFSLGSFAWLGWRSRQAGSSAIVKSIHGKVNFIQDKKKLCLRISDSKIQFEVEPKVKDLFSSDREYRFYYCDIDKTILSVEVV
jgi:hypothetical protein